MATLTTIYGELDEALLEKTTGAVDNDNEYTTWTEYRLGDEIVRRDVHVTLKQPLTLIPDVQGF